MLIFTNDDYRRIQAWLKANSVKDSELPHFTSENGSEKIAIVQDGKNVLITLNELKQLIGGIVRVLTPPTISNVNNKVVIDAKIGTIYYTVGTDHYPHLNSNGDPIDNNTKEYDKPFDINENVTVRAIAKYINSEGELLTSKITEELVYLQKILEAPDIKFENNTVTLAHNNDEGVIYYTLDGSTPTKESNQYTNSFKIYSDCTIKAIVAVDTFVSNVAWKKLEFEYTKIDIPTLKENLTYNGEELIAFKDLDDSEDSPYTISGVIKATNAGEYGATFTLKNTAETKWKDRGEGISDVTVSWRINKKKCEIKWNNPSGDFGEKEVGTKIAFSATADNGTVTFYRNNPSETITSPYTLKDSDRDALTEIVAKNTLNDVDNYIVADDVTKTITVKEQSILYEYQFMSTDDLLTLIEGDTGNLEYLEYEDFPSNWKTFDNGPILLEGESLILAYPPEGDPKLKDDLDGEFITYLLTTNTSKPPYIKIYNGYATGNTQNLTKN